MSFYTSLSGLQASQTDMSTISNNLANSATSGFKRSTTEFADVMASSLAVSPNHMIGSGVAVKDTRQQFSEGNLIQSQSSLDLAITGDGFFATKAQVDGTAVNYTRNGSFLVDASGYVTDAQGGQSDIRKLGPGATAQQLRDYMIHLKGFAGVDGLYDFDQSPQRGLGEQNVIVSRWNADSKHWDVVSEPTGIPLARQ